VGEDRSDDRDDLDDSLELADLAGFDSEAFGGGDGAQAGNEELAPDDEDGNPWLDDAGVVADEDDVAGGDEELIGERVQQHAHGGDLVAAAGEVAVESVSDARENKNDAGDDLLLAAAETGGAVSLPGEGGREDPDEQRNACNTAHRDGVGQIHERVLASVRVVDVDAVPTLAFCHSETSVVVSCQFSVLSSQVVSSQVSVVGCERGGWGGSRFITGLEMAG